MNIPASNTGTQPASKQPLFGSKSRPRDSDGTLPDKGNSGHWKLLIVDDEPEVHSVTRLALNDFDFDGKSLKFISAYSGADAKTILEEDPEIAVVLLDVVMETEDAGLQVVQYVRQVLGNNMVRIILRTGHPGLAPERQVIRAFDINDYRSKTELTQDRMYSLMYTSLAAYKHLTSLARSRRYSSSLADEYRGLLGRIAMRLEQPAGLIGQASKQLSEAANNQPISKSQPAWDQLADGKVILDGIIDSLQRLADVAQASGAMSEFSGNEALSEAITALQEQFDHKHVACRHDRIPQLNGQRNLFMTLMNELLRNAIQAHGSNGGEVEISVAPDGRYWQFKVEDRGKGIEPDRREDIFQAFVGGAHSSKTPRLGVGLALCRAIVGLHGGKLWAEQRQGGGSVIAFTWPADGACE